MYVASLEVAPLPGKTSNPGTYRLYCELGTNLNVHASGVEGAVLLYTGTLFLHEKSIY